MINAFKAIFIFIFAMAAQIAFAANLEGLWSGFSHFSREMVYSDNVKINMGHKEGFAVARPDVIRNGRPTVFLYYRCFDYGVPQICLGIFDETGNVLLEQKGLVVSTTFNVHTVAPSVAKINDVWTMVYEEGGTSDGTYWATSLDGIVWNKHGSLFGGNVYRATPSLYTFQGVNYVFYAQKIAHDKLGIIFHSGSSMTNMVQYGGGYIMLGESPWERASVSMPRIIFQGSYHWMFYEGASVNFLCGREGASNLFGWGIARSTDLIHWEKWGKNPIVRHDATFDPESCGHDMPQPFFNSLTGETSVFYTSNNTIELVRDRLVDGSACTPDRPYPHWKELNGQCMPSCGAMGGTLCYQTKTCGNGSRLGTSYDCGSCCH